jgi:hypothetical protein
MDVTIGVVKMAGATRTSKWVSRLESPTLLGVSSPYLPSLSQTVENAIARAKQVQEETRRLLKKYKKN